MHRLKKAKAYAYIKRLIMDGKWDLEESINVNEITEHLQMSRTPIHKALSQLAQEGFLKIIPQVGVFVRKPKKSGSNGTNFGMFQFRHTYDRTSCTKNK